MSDALTAIVAVAEGGVIGDAGAMPWRLGTDLRRFKRLTMGSPIVMGRKTFDSIGRALPGRETLVLTRQPDWSAAGVERVDVAGVLARCRAAGRGFVVGGAEIYRLFWPHCQRLLVTHVDSAVSGDTRVELPLADFRAVFSQRIPQTERDSLPSQFVVYERIEPVR